MEVPFEEFGFLERGDAYTVQDLLTGERFGWKGRRNYVSLDPQTRPAHVFRFER